MYNLCICTYVNRLHLIITFLQYHLYFFTLTRAVYNQISYIILYYDISSACKPEVFFNLAAIPGALILVAVITVILLLVSVILVILILVAVITVILILVSVIPVILILVAVIPVILILIAVVW